MLKYYPTLMPKSYSSLISCLAWQTDYFTDQHSSSSSFVLFLSFLWSSQLLCSKSCLLLTYVRVCVCVCMCERERGRLQIHTYWRSPKKTGYLDQNQYTICCSIQKATAAQQTFAFIHCRGPQQWKEGHVKEEEALCLVLDQHDIQKENRHTLNKLAYGNLIMNIYKLMSLRLTCCVKRNSCTYLYLCLFYCLYHGHALWICLCHCHTFPAVCSIPRPWQRQSFQCWRPYFLGLRMTHLRERTEPDSWLERTIFRVAPVTSLQYVIFCWYSSKTILIHN